MHCRGCAPPPFYDGAMLIRLLILYRRDAPRGLSLGSCAQGLREDGSTHSITPAEEFGPGLMSNPGPASEENLSGPCFSPSPIARPAFPSVLTAWHRPPISLLFTNERPILLRAPRVYFLGQQNGRVCETQSSPELSIKRNFSAFSTELALQPQVGIQSRKTTRKPEWLDAQARHNKGNHKPGILNS